MIVAAPPSLKTQTSLPVDTEKQAIVDQLLGIIQASNAEASVVLSFGLSKQGHLVGRYRAGAQTFEYEISPDSISDTPVSETRSDSYLKGYYSGIEPAIAIKSVDYLRGWLERFDAAKTSSTTAKKPKCTEGKSRLCGGACIPLKNKDGSDRNCRFDPPPEVKQQIQEVTEKIKKRQNKKSTKQAIASPEDQQKAIAQPEVQKNISPEPTTKQSRWTTKISASENQGEQIIEISEGNNKAQIEIANGSLSGQAISTSISRLDDLVNRETANQINGLTSNINNMTVLTKAFSKKKGKFTKAEEIDSTLEAIAQQSKEGDIVVLPRNVASGLGSSASKAIGARLSIVKGKDEYKSAFVGKVKNGKVIPLDDDDRKRMEVGQKVRSLRNAQMDKINDEFKRGRNDFDNLYKEEDEIADQIAKIEDEWVGRSPKKGAVKNDSHYKKKASQWAESMGLGDSANGFTSDATKAHDIGHPVTHEMTGMSSQELHRSLGGIKQKDGKMSLLGEEAIVNVVEHLSRGDTLEAAIVNGLRVARVLSRNTEYETDEGRKTVRSKEFKDKLIELAEKVYKNDNFNDYMKLVRVANRVSKTVTAAGDDFSDTASGG